MPEQDDLEDRRRISGSPSMDQDAVTSADGALVFTTKIPGGFQVVADAVVTWTSYAGTVNTSIAIPAGMTIPGFISAMQVTSGTIILHYW